MHNMWIRKNFIILYEKMWVLSHIFIGKYHLIVKLSVTVTLVDLIILIDD